VTDTLIPTQQQLAKMLLPLALRNQSAFEMKQVRLGDKRGHVNVLVYVA
jgi:hypothetical protein